MKQKEIYKNKKFHLADTTSDILKLSIHTQLPLQSLIDNPIELLKLINDCLKPKENEKKKFGEVFTPIDFIENEMLKKIEKYYKKKHGISIWKNKELRWFDPAVGMGNFPIAIYYKLMDGLCLV